MGVALSHHCSFFQSKTTTNNVLNDTGLFVEEEDAARGTKRKLEDDDGA